MTRLLYLYDSYLKEFEAKVVKVIGNSLVLDKTAFYPRGGGLVSDTGKIICNGEEYKVIEVKKENDIILHVLDREPKEIEGKNVIGILDWERRYRLMKLHTASHILAAVLYNKYGAKVTGGEITPEYARDDYNISQENWREIFENSIKDVNDIIKKNIPIKIYFMKREEALKIPGIVKLLEKEPPLIDEWRIVEIEGIDIQADGGPHVSNTGEIGEIKLLKLENRGKDKKRIYFTLKE